MSSSSRVTRRLSRCVVTLDTGVRISWAVGASDGGQGHHARAVAEFLRLIDNATPGIEAQLDALEAAGHRMTAPGDAAFAEHAQLARHGLVPSCEVELACRPRLSQGKLDAFAARIAGLLEPAPEEAPTARQKKRWWHFW